MEPSDEGSVLAALEQAEMAARERRLAASSEAERIISTARERADSISAGAGQRVEAALDELRRTTEAAADAAIEDLEAGASREVASSHGTSDPNAAQAVSVVVAHVLGEASAKADGEGLA